MCINKRLIAITVNALNQTTNRRTRNYFLHNIIIVTALNLSSFTHIIPNLFDFLLLITRKTSWTPLTFILCVKTQWDISQNIFIADERKSYRFAPDRMMIFKWWIPLIKTLLILLNICQLNIPDKIIPHVGNQSVWPTWITD